MFLEKWLYRYFWIWTACLILFLHVVLDFLLSNTPKTVWNAVPKDTAIAVQVHDTIFEAVLPIFQTLSSDYELVRQITGQPLSKVLCILQNGTSTSMDWLFLIPVQADLKTYFANTSDDDYTSTQLLGNSVYYLKKLGFFATSDQGIWMCSKRANLVESALKQLKTNSYKVAPSSNLATTGLEIAIFPEYLPTLLSASLTPAQNDWIRSYLQQLTSIKLHLKPDSTLTGTMQFSTAHSASKGDTKKYRSLLPDDIIVARAVYHSATTWAALWQDADFKKYAKTWWKNEGIVGTLKADNQLSDFWITQVAENTTTKLEALLANDFIAATPHLIFYYYTTKNGVYFTLLDDYLIACKSEQAMKNWLDKLIADQVLAKFPLDDTHLPLLYVNIPTLFQFFQSDRNSNRLDNSFLSSIFFGKLTYKSKLAHLQGKFISPATANAESLPEIQWKYELQAPALTSPMRVGDRIFVQDEEKRLYCLSLNGDLIWRRELESKLLSPILMTGQTYFFNTANFIYQTDLSGNDASNGPHRLQSPASNGLTLVDFDQMQAYNYFVACENGNIYGYELPSSPLLGWNPQVIGQIIQHPIKHFQIPEKDFIIAASEKTLFVFQRDGTLRWEPYQAESGFLGIDFQVDEVSKRIVAVEKNGKIHNYNLEGDYFPLSVKLSKNKINTFVYANSWGDKRKDFHFLIGKILHVYAYDKKNTFALRVNRDFDYPQDTIFGISTNQTYAKLGTLDKTKEQIRILDETGKDLPGFPLAGSTAFEIIEISEQKNPLLVTCLRETVYAYSVQLDSR